MTRYSFLPNATARTMPRAHTSHSPADASRANREMFTIVSACNTHRQFRTQIAASRHARESAPVARAESPKRQIDTIVTAPHAYEHFCRTLDERLPSTSALFPSVFAVFSKNALWHFELLITRAHENSRSRSMLIDLTRLTSAARSRRRTASAQTPPTAFANITPPTWMRVGIEHRGRLEGFTGAGFADNREDLYWLNRFRVTARFAMKPWLSAAVQAQDARVEGRNGATTGAPFRDQLDLRLAHVDVGAFDKSRFALRGGRQELVFGDQRLVGHGNWLNTARSFDGVRGVFRHKKLRVDGFAASVVAIQMDDVNRSGGGNYLYGADAPLAVLPYGGVIEPYVFVRTAEKLPTETGSVGDLTSATSGSVS